MSTRTFSNVDAAWLHMDSPTNLAVITGVMTFDEPLDFNRLRQTLEENMCCFERFKQKVKEPRLPFGLPSWETDRHFSIDSHLHRIRLPEPADHTALQNFVGDLMSVPLDRTKPLWHYYYVENYGHGSALVGRLHHCIADGIALMQVLLSMATTEPDPPLQDVEKPCGRQLGLFARLLLPAVKTVMTVNRQLHTAEELVHEGMDILSHPNRWVDVAKMSAATTKALGKLLLIPPDRHTLFKSGCGVPKRAAWSKTLKLEEVKAAGQAMGGTINDILLAAVSGALRRYLEEQGEPTEGLNIRAIVPVNLRPIEEVEELGNRFGLVFLSLPVGVRDPIKRIVLLKRRMDAIKNSPEAIVALGILSAIGMTPIEIENIIVKIFGMKGTAVMTNVPGPRQPLYLAGKAINNIMFWVPHPANLAIGVSIFSYAGDIIVGVATDVCTVPDPEMIIGYFNEEFEVFRQWGRPPAEEKRAEVREKVLSRTIPVPHPELVDEMQPVTQVEAAVHTVQKVAAAAVPAPAGITSSHLTPNDFCQATTRSGLPCKNRALSGSTTCRVHSPR